MEEKIVTGCKLQVLKVMDSESFWREGEVLASRANADGSFDFYIHYINFNKRLDEWVTVDRLDLNTVTFPAPAQQKASGTGPSKNTTHTKASTPASERKRIRPSKAGDKRGTSRSATPTEKARAAHDASAPMDVIMQDATEEETSRATPEPGLISPVRSKAEEIEALRRGGSMTSRPEEVHRVKNIHCIVLAHHKIETWYFSPYPEEFELQDTIYICEFCLSFFNSRVRMDRHRKKCQLFHPPGNEIYRGDNISFFEIDGHKQRMYCRNLCLLSKLFLDHKTLYYDVNPFLYYVMTQNDELGCHIVGYFSKEKESAEGYNVACILTLPNHQRKGYGKLLIQFSYELSKREGKVGSPEKPLSDLGLLSYRSYWSDIILDLLFNLKHSEISVDDISAVTSMTNEDILHTLQAMDLLRYLNGGYVIVLAERHREMYEKMMKKQRTKIDPTCLQWKPPQFSATQLRYI